LQRLLFKWYVQVRWRSVWLPSWHLTALLPRETTKSLVCQRLAPQWRRRTNVTGIVSCSKLKWVLLRLLVCQHLQYPPNRHLLWVVFRCPSTCGHSPIEYRQISLTCREGGS
jgi:hypothetical protein